MTDIRRINRMLAAALMALALVAATLIGQARAGGKGNKGGEEDIILYNGNIVLRGDKSGGNFVLANQHPSHEEIEFAPSFFTGDQGGMEGFGRRRRR